MPAKKRICEKLDKIENLPTLSIVARQLQHLMNQPKVNMASIAVVVARDQAIATQVLKLANSAFYGYPNKFKSLLQAIVVLGLNVIKNIVTGLSIIRVFQDSLDTFSFDRRQFWLHSIGCALGAKLLAQELKYENDEDYFLAGLVHDIGILIIDQFMHPEFAKLLDYKQDAKEYCDAEKTVLGGMCHCDVGAYIAKKWGLGENIVDVIQYHHEPEQCPREESKDLVRVISAANILSVKIRVGNYIENFNSPTPRMKDTGELVDPKKLEEIFLEVEREVKTLAMEWGIYD